MPGIEDGLYLNHGYSGRSPRVVGERIAACQQRWQERGPGAPPVVAECWDAVEAARNAIAALVGAAREAVAMVPANDAANPSSTSRSAAPPATAPTDAAIVEPPPLT